MNRHVAPDPWDIGFGVTVFVASLLAIFVWFPADIRGGFIHVNVTGKAEPGDAFFPILLSATLAILSALQVIISLLRGSPPITPGEQGRLTRDNLVFLAGFLAICVTGLAVMYGLGPVTAWTLQKFGLLDVGYRYLTDTAPYKYLGYVVGGISMTVALIAWTEGRVRLVSVLTVVIVLTTMILIFDQLLANVLLPPNAEF